MAEIQSGIHQIEGNSNSYLVQDSEGSLILVDSGVSKNGKKILDYLEKNLSKKPSDLKKIVLTHAHVDHVRGALEIRRATGATVLIHDFDADYLSDKRKLPRPKGAVGFLFMILSPFIRSPAFDPDIRLKDGDKINSLLVVLHTPGHTPGSISLYDEARKIVFVGDAIISGKKSLEGPPKQFTTDYGLAIESVERISHLDFNVLLSGHGRAQISSGPEKVKDLVLSLKKEQH